MIGIAERDYGADVGDVDLCASIPREHPGGRTSATAGGALVARRSGRFLVLDLQVDFVDWAGRLPISHDQISPVLAAANRAIATENSGHLAVAYIGNEYGFWDIPGNWFRHGELLGSALDPLVTRIAGAPYFAKHQVTLSRTTRSSAFSCPATLEGWFLPASMPTLLHLLHGAIRDKPGIPRDSACRRGRCRER